MPCHWGWRRLQLGTILREKLHLAKAVEGSCSWEESAKASLPFEALL